MTQLLCPAPQITFDPPPAALTRGRDFWENSRQLEQGTLVALLVVDSQVRAGFKTVQPHGGAACSRAQSLCVRVCNSPSPGHGKARPHDFWHNL